MRASLNELQNRLIQIESKIVKRAANSLTMAAGVNASPEPGAFWC